MTRATLQSMNPEERGLFEEIKESATEALDLLTGIDQSDLAAHPELLAKLSREDRIELLVDHETSSSVFGGSPWSIGQGLDQSVADLIHQNHGGTLVFQIDSSSFIDAAEGLVRDLRYALVWDDTTLSDTGPVSISVIGKTFLIIGVKDEPQGQKLTLWLTDNDVKAHLVLQDTLGNIESVRKKVIGDIGAAADKDPNPLTQAFDAVSGFVTTSAVGGVVALAVVAVVLIVLIKAVAPALPDIATAAAKGMK